MQKERQGVWVKTRGPWPDFYFFIFFIFSVPAEARAARPHFGRALAGIGACVPFFENYCLEEAFTLGEPQA